jgi:hypothetical protein
VHELDSDPDLRIKVDQALEEIRSVVHPHEDSYWDDDFKYHTFSDSIIMSSEVSFTGILHIFRAAHSVSLSLFHLGIFVRGGISIGRLRHDGDKVYGIGLIKAYELENEKAIFPRIILDKEVLNEALVVTGGDDELIFAIENCLISQIDGYHMIHYLDVFECFGPGHASEMELDDNLLPDGKENLVLIIQNKLEKSIGNTAVFEKLQWLANYWNYSINNHCTSEIRTSRYKVDLPPLFDDFELSRN